MSYARLLIGDRFGNILTEIQPDIESVSWRLNKVGQLKFTISTTDPKATETNLKFGNRVLIDFENGLPDWGGIIYPPRGWDQNIISVTAYSAEYIFNYRITGKSKDFSGNTIGEIFTALIDDANAEEDTGVSVNEVFPGGDLHSPDYHYKSILEIFQQSLTLRMSNFDFALLPTITDGKIVFTANLYESRGSDKTGLALIQDKNLTKIRLVEQGPIINSWTVIGKGIDWGDDRLTKNEVDNSSIDEYGLRQDSQVYYDVLYQSTLDNHARNLLAESKDPYNIFTLEALDTDPAGFASYDVGDTISLVTPDYGFGGTDTTIRILSREYLPGTGKCALVVQAPQVGVEQDIGVMIFRTDGITIGESVSVGVS